MDIKINVLLEDRDNHVGDLIRKLHDIFHHKNSARNAINGKGLSKEHRDKYYKARNQYLDALAECQEYQKKHPSDELEWCIADPSRIPHPTRQGNVGVRRSN